MAWLKPMLKLQSAFRAPSRFAQSAAQQLGKSTQHLRKGPQHPGKGIQHPGKGIQHPEKGTQHLGKDSSPAFEIRSSPGKGLGVFATKNIPRDAVIMRDPLVFQFEKGEGLVERYSRFTMLPVAIRQNILKLCVGQNVLNHRWDVNMLRLGGTNRQKESIIEMLNLEDIIDTNAFTVSNNTGSIGRLFLNASRINHSCVPNADRVSNEGAPYLVMRANRDIIAGEEITYSYFVRIVFRAARQQHLSAGWGFTCQCPACDTRNPFCHSHERRLQALIRLYQDSYSYMDYEGRLKSAETMSYEALEQAADNARRRIQLLAEHHSLRVFARETYLGAFDIAVSKYRLRLIRSDLEEGLKLLELVIKEDKLYYCETITREHEDLYHRLQRGDISGM